MRPMVPYTLLDCKSQRREVVRSTALGRVRAAGGLRPAENGQTDCRVLVRLLGPVVSETRACGALKALIMTLR